MLRSNKSPQGLKKIISKESGTTIDVGCNIKGDVKEENTIILRGALNGNLDVEKLAIIEETGILNGNLTCFEGVIRGIVNGDVLSHGNLRLDSKARINGNISYKLISVEEGAVFKGTCTNMESENQINLKLEEKMSV